MKPDLIILGLLAKTGPSSGQELHHHSEGEFPSFVRIPRATVYRHLQKLATEGLIRESGRKPGRAKENILYKVTAEGRRYFRTTMQEVDVEVEHAARPSLTTSQFADYMVLALLYSKDLGLDAIRRRIGSIKNVMTDRSNDETGWEPAQILLNCVYTNLVNELNALELIEKGLAAGLYQ